MSIVIKKKIKNGNIYFYYHNGKIKTVKPDGTITWKTKRIFKTKKTNKRP